MEITCTHSTCLIFLTKRAEFVQRRSRTDLTHPAYLFKAAENVKLLSSKQGKPSSMAYTFSELVVCCSCSCCYCWHPCFIRFNSSLYPVFYQNKRVGRSHPLNAMSSILIRSSHAGIGL